jgi:hypothetical protein
MNTPHDDGPTDAEFEQMFRDMLKRDLAGLNDALADNPNPGDAEAYRSNIKYITEVLALPKRGLPRSRV